MAQKVPDTFFDSLRGLKHPLTARLGLLLSLFILLMLVAYAASAWAVAQMAHDSFVLNVAGRQRALIQIYTRQINRSLVALAISDWETLLEERAASASTARFFETTHQAFLEGGVTRFGAQSAQELRIPRTKKDRIRERLAEVSREWAELKRVAGLALRSDAQGLKDNEYISAMQEQCMLAAAAMDSAVSQMQQDSENKLHRIKGFQAVTTGLGCLLLVGIMFFVHFKIVAPLDRASGDLSKLNESLLVVNKEVAQQNKFLNTVLESLDHPFMVIDAEDYSIHMANAAARREAPLQAKTCHAMTHHRDTPCDGAEDECPLAEVKRTGRPAKTEHVHYQADGSPRNVEVHAYPVFDESGRVVQVIEYSLDITERKRAEAQLEDINKQLLDISRQAGMAEVATGVLHNVGNVLNSVNVSASVVADKLHKSRVLGLAKAANLMREHADDLGSFVSEDEKGKQLPGYLTRLAEHLSEEQAASLEELKSLTANIEHIKKIIRMQQSYTGVCGVIEPVSIGEVLDDALKIDEASLQRHGVRVVREYNETPALLVDKHKLLQILVNLVRNAKHSLLDARRQDKRLTLRIEPGRDGQVRIEVIDNGVGIAKENLTRIFAYGFTTKKDGHGFGLHSSALAAKEMGGSLTAHSDGPGKGASFTLELPLKEVEARR